MRYETGFEASTGYQRVNATGQLGVKWVEGRTRLSRLYQEGAAKIRMPRSAGGPLEAVLINTAGGLTGGDRIHWDIDIADNASTVVTTQACEKIYRALSDRAEMRVTIRAGAHSRIAWLPQETIVFDRANFSRTLDLELADSAEALIVESTVFGRLAMGERANYAIFRDRWRVRQAGRMVHAEDFSIGPDIAATLSRTAVAGGAIAVATLMLVSGDAESLLDRARSIVGDNGGTSFWTVGGTGKLLARLYADDSYTLRKRLIPLVELLNAQAHLPKVWSI